MMPCLQEESRKLRKMSSAGLYFLRLVTATVGFGLLPKADAIEQLLRSA